MNKIKIIHIFRAIEVMQSKSKRFKKIKSIDEDLIFLCQASLGNVNYLQKNKRVFYYKNQTLKKVNRKSVSYNFTYKFYLSFAKCYLYLL